MEFIHTAAERVTTQTTLHKSICLFGHAYINQDCSVYTVDSSLILA